MDATLPNPGYTLDVPKAKALLAEAGYPNGFETTLRVLSDQPFLNLATSVQFTLAQAGIRAKIISGTGNQVYSAMRDRKFEILVGRAVAAGSIPIRTPACAPWCITRITAMKPNAPTSRGREPLSTMHN